MFYFVYMCNIFNDLQCMFNVFDNAGRQGRTPNGNWLTEDKYIFKTIKKRF